jgi:hypothetical protein
MTTTIGIKKLLTGLVISGLLFSAVLQNLHARTRSETHSSKFYKSKRTRKVIVLTIGPLGSGVLFSTHTWK